MIALPITAALLAYSWALVHTLHAYRGELEAAGAEAASLLDQVERG